MRLVNKQEIKIQDGDISLGELLGSAREYPLYAAESDESLAPSKPEHDKQPSLVFFTYVLCYNIIVRANIRVQQVRLVLRRWQDLILLNLELYYNHQKTAQMKQIFKNILLAQKLDHTKLMEMGEILIYQTDQCKLWVKYNDMSGWSAILIYDGPDERDIVRHLETSLKNDSRTNELQYTSGLSWISDYLLGLGVRAADLKLSFLKALQEQSFAKKR